MSFIAYISHPYLATARYQHEKILWQLMYKSRIAVPLTKQLVHLRMDN
jgi:hypothetical protein